MNIRTALTECARSFTKARNGDRESANQAAKQLCNELTNLLPENERVGMRLKTGLGMGRFADVPWVAVLHEKLGATATTGYYVVYLFSKDSSRVYLSLIVGAGAGAGGGWTLADQRRVETRAHKLRDRIKNIEYCDFSLYNSIDLASDVWRVKSYVTATAAHKGYEINDLPEVGILESDFLKAIRCFSSLVGEGFSLDQDVQFSSMNNFHNTPISRALLSKPFLILTGPSGTGKTRGAIRLAESVCEPDCRVVVAVGADWTDNRHVLGFLNPLQTADGTPTGIPIYEASEILKLLLHANANPDLPHVLILDEMNLSHVERYFADFLSAMELTDKKKALKLHSAVQAKTREDLDVAGSIDFPENLFVIGTVNIDETTYMFSPKVLDRANVIEIHAEETALEKFLHGKVDENDSVASNRGISFLDAARIIRNDEDHAQVPQLPIEVRRHAADRLMELFRIMKRGRGEFGFRTGREVLAYLRSSHFLTAEAERGAWAATDGGWMESLDGQILQKILPKLHGSRTRLAPLLGALATYCGTGDAAAAMEHFPEAGNSPRRGLNDARNIQNPIFENSYKKLERMIGVLVEEQFVSFIC